MASWQALPFEIKSLICTYVVAGLPRQYERYWWDFHGFIEVAPEMHEELLAIAYGGMDYFEEYLRSAKVYAEKQAATSFPDMPNYRSFYFRMRFLARMKVEWERRA